jgi:4a-hydroxytetrahydrobiopterin dehydratase
MTKLSDDDIRSALADLPGWSFESDALRKEYRFSGFRAAIGFIVRLADEAHAARHHPDLENHYNRVLVSLTTHDAGGVTDSDVALARAIEGVAEPPAD